MIEAIGTSLTSVIGWAGDVVDALVTTEGALNGVLPLFALGLGFSVCLFGVKIVKSFLWGA